MFGLARVPALQSILPGTYLNVFTLLIQITDSPKKNKDSNVHLEVEMRVEAICPMYLNT